MLHSMLSCSEWHSRQPVNDDTATIIIVAKETRHSNERRQWVHRQVQCESTSLEHIGWYVPLAASMRLCIMYILLL